MASTIARALQTSALFVSLWPLCVPANTAPKPGHFKCEPGKVGSKTFDADGSQVELLVRGPGCPDADPVVPASLQAVPAGLAKLTDEAQVVSDSPHMHAHSASASSVGSSAQVTPSNPGRTWLVVGSVLLILGLVSGLAARLYDVKARQPQLKAAAEKAQREKEEEEQRLLQMAEEGQRRQEQEEAEQERLRAQEEAREASEREEREEREAREREEAERKAREQEERQRLDGEALAREEAARLESERRATAETEAKAREAEAKAKAEAEAKAQKRCAPCCGSKPAAAPGPR